MSSSRGRPDRGGHQSRFIPRPRSTVGDPAPVGRGVSRPLYKTFGEPPPNYVAGLGRGATGFTTRSDIGPARDAGGIPDPFLGRQQHQQMRHDGGDDDDDSAAMMGAGSFDAWSGYNESGLLSSAVQTQDDEEAEKVWREVDVLADRGRKRRLKKAAAAAAAAEKAEQRPGIAGWDPASGDVASTFADLKGTLASVSEAEWNAIPDMGEYGSTTTKRARRMDTFTPMPDTLLESARQETQGRLTTSIDEGPQSGTATAAAPHGGVPTDLRALGLARESIMKSQLKRLEDSVTGKTTIDPKGYITSLESRSVLGAAEMGDLRKAQTLLKNITRTNPTNPAGWISRARVEELAGKMSTARSVIMEACEACPDNEDVWLEAARLHPIATAKAILAQSIAHVPYSVNIWIAAANLEHTLKAKKRVLRKALEMIPNSVQLWKEAVSLEEPDDARLMLQRAVECIPGNVDLWLALARLEDYEEAKKVLNRARRHLPTEPLIWIAAAELEESYKGHGTANVDRIIQKGIKSLQANLVTIKREDWIAYAYRAEEAGHVSTCHAIVRATIGVGIEDVDREHTWIDDARAAVNPEDPNEKPHVETARAIYAHALSVFPQKTSLWHKAAALEKEHGTSESLLDLLRRAVEHCPKSEELWLMAAKEKWLSGDVQGAREILLESFKVNKDNEDIWLAAVKIEVSSGQFDDARALLARAREQAGTERVWMTSAVFERNMGNRQRELELLNEGLQRFPQSDKMHIMKGQWEERAAEQAAAKNADKERHYEKAREAYVTGLRKCIHSIPLWLCAAKLEEKTGNTTRARALLEKARLRNPKIPELWLAAIRLEVRSSNIPNAQSLMAKALQDCPTAGILLKESIELEPRPKQRATGVQALRANSEDPAVLTAVAKLFWRERKIDVARSWFKRATVADKDYGDAWAHAYKFELQHGSDEQQKEIVEACVAADPHHGEMWCLVSKQPQHYNLGTEELLKKVADLVDVNSPFTEMTTYVSPSSAHLAQSYRESSQRGKKGSISGR